jgi:hypothetical protein
MQKDRMRVIGFLGPQGSLKAYEASSVTLYAGVIQWRDSRGPRSRRLEPGVMNRTLRTLSPSSI